MKRLAALLLLGGALATARAGEAPASAFFARIAGSWQGSGEVRRMAADMRMRWEPVLDGQFTRLSLENRMTGADGQSWHFKAEAYYRVLEDGGIAGTWFDSRGISLALTGQVDGDTMRIDWGSADLERGRSSYRLTADALEVTDEVYSGEGELQVFGRTRLARVDLRGIEGD